MELPFELPEPLGVILFLVVAFLIAFFVFSFVVQLLVRGLSLILKGTDDSPHRFVSGTRRVLKWLALIAAGYFSYSLGGGLPLLAVVGLLLVVYLYSRIFP